MHAQFLLRKHIASCLLVLLVVAGAGQVASVIAPGGDATVFAAAAQANRPTAREFYEPEFRQAARHGKWKAVRLTRNDAVELYDLCADPSETTNVAAAHPEVVGAFDRFFRTAHRGSAEYPDPT